MAKRENNYEEMLKELQFIVDDLDSGEMPLEESIKKYEQGVKLLNKLYKKLNALEGKIKIVNNDVEKDLGGEINEF
ncbi:exodeoxyribonuclease VII small subunit [Clostridium tarantellae]|uniref:Exodeoxyribonuclease 7 small subunit n=1 Tax=Clostridium tarantellae TaxID=39493 RepID=A0A6I1MIL7_9CLOT|nr:exodeoxyribonuclease VII small subunit [Clostridium tarantellae]MPQ42754.1 exodeoxyribonuclease VII small subunit [Clostridium tarantellae]